MGSEDLRLGTAFYLLRFAGSFGPHEWLRFAGFALSVVKIPILQTLHTFSKLFVRGTEIERLAHSMIA